MKELDLDLKFNDQEQSEFILYDWRKKKFLRTFKKDPEGYFYEIKNKNIMNKKIIYKIEEIGLDFICNNLGVDFEFVCKGK